MLVGEALEGEQAGIGQFDQERGVLADLGLAAHLQDDLVERLADLLAADVDADRDLGAGWPGSRVCGALGFSNEKSLTYWALMTIGRAVGRLWPAPDWSVMVISW